MKVTHWRCSVNSPCRRLAPSSQVCMISQRIGVTSRATQPFGITFYDVNEYSWSNRTEVSYYLDGVDCSYDWGTLADDVALYFTKSAKSWAYKRFLRDIRELKTTEIRRKEGICHKAKFNGVMLTSPLCRHLPSAKNRAPYPSDSSTPMTTRACIIPCPVRLMKRNPDSWDLELGRRNVVSI